MKPDKTFADLVAEVKKEPTPSSDADERSTFRDPAGNLLEKLGELTPSQARERVRQGAQLAFEDCGCGGAYGGCVARWVDADVRQAIASSSSPRLARGKRSVSWQDLWSGDGGFVVYAHSSVKWGEALS